MWCLCLLESPVVAKQEQVPLGSDITPRERWITQVYELRELKLDFHEWPLGNKGNEGSGQRRLACKKCNKLGCFANDLLTDM